MAVAKEATSFREGTDILLGLGYPSMAAFGFTPVFDHLMKLQVLPQNLFSFWLSMKEDIPSQLMFGKIDQTKFTGELQYFPVVDKQFWSILLIDVKVKPIKIIYNELYNVDWKLIAQYLL